MLGHWHAITTVVIAHVRRTKFFWVTAVTSGITLVSAVHGIRLTWEISAIIKFLMLTLITNAMTSDATNARVSLLVSDLSSFSSPFASLAYFLFVSEGELLAEFAALSDGDPSDPFEDFLEAGDERGHQDEVVVLPY